MLTCWALPFNVGLKIGQFYQKKHYKTTLEGRKTGTRAVWPKLGVLECGLDIFPCVLSSFLLGMELKDIYSCKKLINNYSTSARWIWVGYNHLVSNKRELNNCFIENAHKISKILADFICKNNQFWADAYSYQRRTNDLLTRSSKTNLTTGERLENLQFD